MKKIFLLCFLIFSCARAPLKDSSQAFRLASAPPLQDALTMEGFREALDRTLAAYSSSNTIPNEFQFGERKISRAQYLAALEALKAECTSIESLQAFIQKNFDFYEVYGTDSWGKVFSTGYYDPLMLGSPKKTQKFSQALYKTPEDLVSIDLTAFAQRNPDLLDLQKLVKSMRAPSFRGRIAEKKILPYYERKDIDLVQGASPLSGKNLELAWVNPIDAFFLQIQGSGIVEFYPGQRIRVGYAGANGSSYFAIGKALTNVIPMAQMSMQRIRQHLQTLNPDQLQEVLNKNPSYVFFQELQGKSLTYSGAEVTPGRTVATDQFLIPKGLLAYFEIETPEFSDAVSLEPSAWKFQPRFVFNQDTGGAIRGGGRVDLYYGEGAESERAAGVMKRDGRMWYAAPKEEFLRSL